MRCTEQRRCAVYWLVVSDLALPLDSHRACDVWRQYYRYNIVDSYIKVTYLLDINYIFGKWGIVMSTKEAAFVQAVALFNDEAYRDALLAFEEIWFVERSDFLKGLIQLSNGLLQLRLGLINGPRRTLASAAVLFTTCAPGQAGLDVARLRDELAAVRAQIPASPATQPPPWDALPRVRLVLRAVD